MSEALDPHDRAMANRRLAEVLLNMGRIQEAEKHARDAVKDAPSDEIRSENKQVHALLDYECKVRLDCPSDDINQCEPMNTRVILGHVLHHAGQLEMAEKHFRDAEEIQRLRPDRPSDYLEGVFNYWFIILLLQLGKRQEVRERLEKLDLQESHPADILWCAMDNLSRCYSYLPANDDLTKEVDVDKAQQYLKSEPDLINASQIPHLPFAWLAWAHVHILKKDYDKARDLLEEVRRFAKERQMRLHMADCDLLLVRVHLKLEEWDQAKRYYCEAAELVYRTRYGRRYKDLVELGEELFSRMV